MSDIKWSQYIPHDPFPKQLTALRSDAKELLFGGALGGGKSDYLLMCCLQYMDVPGYASAIFRQSLSDLALPGALMDRAKEWLQPFVKTPRNKNRPVRWSASEHTYYFDTFNPDGSPGAPAQLVFCYIGDANIKDRYQSAEFQTICFDEISQWETDGDFKFMTTRLRKNVCSIHKKNRDGTPNYVKGCPECFIKQSSPTRLRAATNPGGKGGLWIKRRYQIEPDPELYPDKRDAIRAIMKGVKVPFVGTHPSRVFVPSLIEDNYALNQTDYDEFLDDLDPMMRSQLRDGNWEARADSRYHRHWARYYRLYPEHKQFEMGGTTYPFSWFKRIFSTCDIAGTTKEGIIDQVAVNKPKTECFTVVSTWGVSPSSDLFWLGMKRDRAELPETVDMIADQYAEFEPLFMKIEDNGVGLGATQYARNVGIPVKAIHKGKDKLENSTAAQLLMRARKVWLPDNAPWINECEDEIFNWTGHPNEQDDIIDTLSDAANELGPTTDTMDEKDTEKINNSFKVMRGLPRPGGLINLSSPMAQRMISGSMSKTVMQEQIRRESY